MIKDIDAMGGGSVKRGEGDWRQMGGEKKQAGARCSQ